MAGLRIPYADFRLVTSSLGLLAHRRDRIKIINHINLLFFRLTPKPWKMVESNSSGWVGSVLEVPDESHLHRTHYHNEIVARCFFCWAVPFSRATG